jgi:hypothetical protein
VSIDITIFYDVKPCSLVETYETTRRSVPDLHISYAVLSIFSYFVYCLFCTLLPCLTHR